MHIKRTQEIKGAPSERVLQRPHVTDWEPDELLTLPEAAFLYWPEGPITTATLRTAVRKRELGVTVIASRFFTTRRAIEAMSVPAIRQEAPKKDAAVEQAVRPAGPTPASPAPKKSMPLDRLHALEHLRRRA
jgi:hypothetical protein